MDFPNDYYFFAIVLTKDNDISYIYIKNYLFLAHHTSYKFITFMFSLTNNRICIRKNVLRK